MVVADLGDVEEVDLRFGRKVENQARGVTQVRWPEDWQDQVRTTWQAIETQRLAEVFALTRQAHHGRRIPQPGDADRGIEQQSACGVQRALALELEQAVQQVRDIAQVAEEVADAGAQKVRCDVAIAVDHRQEYPLIEAIVEVIHPTVPRLQRVIDVEGVEGCAFELSLVQARVEFQRLQRFGETVRIGDPGNSRGVGGGWYIGGMGYACAQQSSDKQEMFSHGRTPAWRRC